MKTPARIVAFWICFSVLLIGGCGKEATASLQNPSSIPIDFYGVAIDENGAPLSGVTLEMVVISVTGDAVRGHAKQERVSHVVVSDDNGKMSFHGPGESVLVTASKPGYRWLYDKRPYSTGPAEVRRFNYFYQYANWGSREFQPDESNPAVYVLVKDSVVDVAARVCRGGADKGSNPNGGGIKWFRNEPGVPFEPSIAGLRFVDPVQSTTKPE